MVRRGLTEANCTDQGNNKGYQKVTHAAIVTQLLCQD